MKHKIENTPSLMLMSILFPPKELDNPQTIGKTSRNQRVAKGLQVEEKFSSRGETYLADKVSIGGEVEESAALNIEAEDKGILVPRLTTVQMEAISSPATGLIVYNTDEVAFMYWNGNDWIAIAGSGGDATLFIEVTKAELDTHIQNATLVKGATYKITGVHNTRTVQDVGEVPALYDDGRGLGTTIFLKAVGEDELESSGSGLFFNPKYDKQVNGYGIWDNKITVSLSNVSGNFDFANKEVSGNFDFANKEEVTADNGAKGQILTKGWIVYISGDWGNATSITGDDSGATADVSNVNVPAYNVNDVVFWGGYAWKNLNGNLGSSDNMYTLNAAEWEKLDYTHLDYYSPKIDFIEYDYLNDLITRRRDEACQLDASCNKMLAYMLLKNEIKNAISAMQWGNDVGLTGNGVFINKAEGLSLIDCVNFRGGRISFNSLEGNSRILTNSLEGNSRILTNSLEGDSVISTNSLEGYSYISINSLEGYSRMSFNSLEGSSGISINSLEGNSEMSTNSLEGYSRILTNSLEGYSYISINSLEGYSRMSFNSLEGSSGMRSNSLKGGSYMEYNSLEGGSYMEYNSLEGDSYISTNSLEGDSGMRSNSLEGDSYISTNSLEGGSGMRSNSLEGSSGISINSLEGGSQVVNLSLNSSYFKNNQLLNFIADFSNVIYTSKTFENIRFEGNNGTTYTIPDLTSATIIFDASKTQKKVFDDGAGGLKLQYFDGTNFVIGDITD